MDGKYQPVIFDGIAGIEYRAYNTTHEFWCTGVHASCEECYQRFAQGEESPVRVFEEI